MVSPSPWSVSEKAIHVRDKDGQQVCLVGPLSTVEDAHLIAAAPALLACCKELRDILALAMRGIAGADLGNDFQEALFMSGFTDGFGARADTVIAQAEGR